MKDYIKIKQNRIKDKIIFYIDQTFETYQYIGLSFGYEYAFNGEQIMNINIDCDLFEKNGFYIPKEIEGAITDIIIKHFKNESYKYNDFRVKYNR